MSNIIVAIFKTKDYAQFKKMKGQRPLNEKKVITLMNAIDVEVGNIQPILVYTDKTVWDGQHRLEACKRLGAPVEYKVTENIGKADAIVINNTSTKWKNIDYLQYSLHNTLTGIEYDIMKDLLSTICHYKNNTLLTEYVLLKFFAGGSSAKLHSKDVSIASSLSIKLIAEKAKVIDQLNMLHNSVSSAKALSFLTRGNTLTVLNVLYFFDKFDMAKFCTKAAKYEDRLYACTNAELVVELIEDVYNYRSRNRLDIITWYKNNKTNVGRIKAEKIKQLG
jgi:hypothetical protein